MKKKEKWHTLQTLETILSLLSLSHLSCRRIVVLLLAQNGRKILHTLSHKLNFTTRKRFENGEKKYKKICKIIFYIYTKKITKLLILLESTHLHFFQSRIVFHLSIFYPLHELKTNGSWIFCLSVGFLWSISRRTLPRYTTQAWMRKLFIGGFNQEHTIWGRRGGFWGPTTTGWQLGVCRR